MKIRQPVLPVIIKQLHYYKMLADKTMTQLAPEHLHWQFNPESNSIAILIRHISGNMKSRFTDFLTEDGEKSWRNREEEFKIPESDQKELLLKWEEGWSCLFAALASLSEADLERVVYIRNAGHTVLEALERQLAHYAYHVGQIVFIGKMLQGSDWKSLSIPKGTSEEYNRRQFDQPRSRRHFTDDPT